jgi:hypothetical protein
MQYIQVHILSKLTYITKLTHTHPHATKTHTYTHPHFTKQVKTTTVQQPHSKIYPNEYLLVFTVNVVLRWQFNY